MVACLLRLQMRALIAARCLVRGRAGPDTLWSQALEPRRSAARIRRAGSYRADLQRKQSLLADQRHRSSIADHHLAKRTAVNAQRYPTEDRRRLAWNHRPSLSVTQSQQSYCSAKGSWCAVVAAPKLGVRRKQ